MGLSGVEPLTSRLSGARSNQLSYRPKLEPIGGPEIYQIVSPDRTFIQRQLSTYLMPFRSDESEEGIVSLERR